MRRDGYANIGKEKGVSGPGRWLLVPLGRAIGHIVATFMVLVVLCGSICVPSALGHKPDQPADVVVFDQPLFTIKTRIGPYKPVVRAKSVSDRIMKLIDNPKFDSSTFRVVETNAAVDVMAGDTVITTITNADASADDRDKVEMAHEYMATIRSTIESGKAKKNVEHVLEQVKWRNFSATLLHLLSNPMSLMLVISLAGLLLLLFLSWSIKRSFGGYFLESSQRYTFFKVVEFSGYFIGLVLVTVVFRDTLGNLAVILGAATAGIAFALKEVIVSIAGWVAVAFSDLYKVGDRVQLGGIKGDVIDIGFVRTTLMELGEWVNGDLYTGRIVRIANSVVFSAPLFNYSRDLPFIWDEILINVKYGSDGEKARQIMEGVLTRQIGSYAEEAKEHWEGVKDKYIVEDERIDPFVSLNLASGGMEYTLRYPVDYKRRRTTKDRLFQEIASEVERSDGAVNIS